APVVEAKSSHDRPISPPSLPKLTFARVVSSDDPVSAYDRHRPSRARSPTEEGRRRTAPAVRAGGQTSAWLRTRQVDRGAVGRAVGVPPRLAVPAPLSVPGARGGGGGGGGGEGE